MSGASERANGRASGPVLTSLFLYFPDHSSTTGETFLFDASSVQTQITKLSSPSHHHEDKNLEDNNHGGGGSVTQAGAAADDGAENNNPANNNDDDDNNDGVSDRCKATTSTITATATATTATTTVNPDCPSSASGVETPQTILSAVSMAATVATAHCGTKPGHFETSRIHFPTSEGVSEVSERANE